MHNLLDDGKVGTLGLEDHKTALALTTGTTADLCHHHESMLIGAEVGIVKHRVGIKDTHHADLVEV